MPTLFPFHDANAISFTMARRPLVAGRHGGTKNAALPAANAVCEAGGRRGGRRGAQPCRTGR